MGSSIGLKLNEKICSKYLKDKYYSWETDESVDSIYCLSGPFSDLITSQFYLDEELMIPELSKAINFNCEFLFEPKINHSEENDDTLFKTGWVNSKSFIEKLKSLKHILLTTPDFHKSLQLPDAWKWFFESSNEGIFVSDIKNMIEVLEIGNQQTASQFCYISG